MWTLAEILSWNDTVGMKKPLCYVPYRLKNKFYLTWHETSLSLRLLGWALHMGMGNVIFTYSLTSQDFSWLQNGQLNIVSNASMIFLLGGGFLFDFLLPILSPENKTNLNTRVYSTYMYKYHMTKLVYIVQQVKSPTFHTNMCFRWPATGTLKPLLFIH